MKMPEVIDGLLIALIEKIDIEEDPNSAGDQIIAIRRFLQEELGSDDGSKPAFEITVATIKKEGVIFEKDYKMCADQVAHIYNGLAKEY